MKNLSYFLFALTIIFSSCSDDDVPNEQLLLTEFEKSIIPFTTETNFQFKNENNEPTTATASARVFGQATVETELGFHTMENVSNTLTFPEMGLNFAISVSQVFFDRSSFYIVSQYNEPSPSGLFLNPDCSGVVDDSIGLESYLTDITVQDVTYNNVFILEDCREESSYSQIIYSMDGGIEYIEFDDGTYLMQD